MNTYRKEVVVIGAAGIDTNIYLYGKDIDFSIEANFSENIDCIGQAGGYSARAFDRLGIRTAYLGYIGEDFLGDFIRTSFREEDIESLFFLDRAGTKRSINFMYSDGRRKNFYDGKGAMEIKPELGKCRSFLAGSRIAHLSIVNWTRYLLPLLRELGIVISVDIQDVVSPDDSYREDYIKSADILFFSSVNFQDDLATPVQRFLDLNPDLKILAGRGESGCAYADMAGIRYVDAVDLDLPIVDTNGAGDSLAAGFLKSYIFDGFELEDSILRAQICARYCCSLKANSWDLISEEKLDFLFQKLKHKT